MGEQTSEEGSPERTSLVSEPVPVPPRSGRRRRTYALALIVGALAGVGVWVSSTRTGPIPVPVPGILAWFSAGSTHGMSRIDQWNSLGGLPAVALQEDPTARPGFKEDPVARVAFDGKRYLTADALTSRIRELSGISVVTVAKAAPLGRQIFWSMHLADQASDLLRLGVRDNKLELKCTPRIGKDYRFSSPLVVDEPAIYTTIASGNQVIVYRNGGEVMREQSPKPLNFAGATFFSIGQEWDGKKPSDLLRGSIFELIVIEGALPVEERSRLEQYLIVKYGIAANPGG